MAYTARQDLMIRAYLAIVAKLGPFTRDAGSEGAGYVEAVKNTGAPTGFKCENCAFFRAPKGCAIMRGPVERAGVCRLYVIPQEKLKAPEPAKAPQKPLGRIVGHVR
jgi:hypothetical protein